MTRENVLRSMKVLYVEDDAAAKEELADVLKRRVGKLILGENGAQGIELFRDYRPDIILADVYMPEVNGIEMIRRIRAEHFGEDVPVVIISAVNDIDTILGAVDAGINKYVVKPVNLQELLQVLAELAEQSLAKRSKEHFTLPENRHQMEDALKREFAAMLKQTTGKGPRSVDVYAGEDTIEVIASDVMTVMERELLDNNQNIGIIKYIRETFYSVKAEKLCRMIEQISGCDVILQEVSVSAEKNRDKLIFAISRSG